MAEGFFTTVWVYSLPKATLLAECIKCCFRFLQETSTCAQVDSGERKINTWRIADPAFDLKS